MTPPRRYHYGSRHKQQRSPTDTAPRPLPCTRDARRDSEKHSRKTTACSTARIKSARSGSRISDPKTSSGGNSNSSTWVPLYLRGRSGTNMRSTIFETCSGASAPHLAIAALVCGKKSPTMSCARSANRQKRHGEKGTYSPSRGWMVYSTLQRPGAREVHISQDSTRNGPAQHRQSTAPSSLVM